jgi:hypothetical protein
MILGDLIASDIVSSMPINPFPCGSLWNVHRAASEPISPDKIGLFGPVPAVENTSPHSCGPIGQAPFRALLIWACKLVRKLLPHTPPPPPPDILCCHTDPRQKSGAVLAFTQRFWHEDFILRKSL